MSAPRPPKRVTHAHDAKPKAAPTPAPARAPRAEALAGASVAPAWAAVPAPPFGLAAPVGLQCKLAIGAADDPYEREADRVADHVAGEGSASAAPSLSPFRRRPPAPVQRATLGDRTAHDPDARAAPAGGKGCDCGSCTVCTGTTTVDQEPPAAAPAVQRKTDDDEGGCGCGACAACGVQRKRREDDDGAVQAKRRRWGDGGERMREAAEHAVARRGPGAPLPRETRRALERGMGVDLGGVRVHDGPDAQRDAARLRARAFTHGRDVWLGRGERATDVRLMAHEAAHVVQQGAAGPSSDAAAPSAPSAARGTVQRLIPDWVLEELDEYARHVPGWSLFTVVIGYNPLTQRDVERTPTNLLGGFMGLVPFGTAIFDTLNEYGIVQDAFDWVRGELDRLDLSLGRLERTIEAAWDDVSLTSGFDYNMGVLRRHFGPLYDDVVSFAESLVDRVLEMIRAAVVNVAEPLLAENRAWALAKKVMGRDPLRDEPVEATPVEMLEDFLMLIGQEEHLRQMRERGTLQEAADWLATQVSTFVALLGQLRGLITRAWDAIQPANLPNLLDSLRSLAADAGAFLQDVWDFATTVAAKVLEFIKKALLGWLASFADDVPGFHLVTVILGRNPFTDEPVPRTPQNLIRGFITLLPSGAEIYARLEETGTIARAAARISGAVEALGISWDFIVGIFRGLWDSFSVADLADPVGAFTRIVDRFAEPVSRLFRFVTVVLREIISIILEVMNFPGDLVGSIISNAMQAVDDVKRNPIGFLQNMLAAVKRGFSRFFDNIVTHLVGGLADWLFRGLRQAGIEPPRDLSLRSVLDFVLQVLGITVERLWEKLGERIGPERVARIRGAIDRLTGIWTFVQDVQQRGIAAVWEHIQSQISGLWDMVLSKAREWIMERIINRAIQWLLSLLDVTGIMPVINSFIAFFNAVQSAIEYFRDILSIINDYVSTIAAVARGEIDPGAQKLERGLANAIPVAIGFLAAQFGLGRIGDKIQEIVGGIRETVDRALTWLVDRAVTAGQSLLASLGLGGRAGEAEGEEQARGDRVELADFEELGAHHEIYIDLSGGRAQLMVASDDPHPVTALLDHLESRLDQIPTEDRRRRDATRYIGQARRALADIPVAAAANLNVQRAIERSVPLEIALRPLFQIFCIHRTLEPATDPQARRGMQVYVEITIEEEEGAASPPASGRIPAVEGTSAANRGRPGGQVLGATSTGGRTYVQARTWAVGEARMRGDPMTHAERQFVDWISVQPWLGRVRALEVHNRDYSPCTSCSSALRGLLRDNPQIRTAVLFWSTPYVLEPITTRPSDINSLTGVGWAVHPGSSALSLQGADLCPRT